jgi:putative aldouronate transport system permease protein
MILYMPNFISVIVLCGMVRILLSVTGPINLAFHTGINFMTMPEAFRSIYIISGIWQGAGWASIMYTASLSNASQELREAAVIDGANIFQQIKAVDWPAIKDMVVIQFILSAGNIMSIGLRRHTRSRRILTCLHRKLSRPTSIRKVFLTEITVFPRQSVFLIQSSISFF